MDIHLNSVLKYRGAPIRAGIVDNKVVLSLSDLRSALGLGDARVENITRGLPDEVYFRARSVDKHGQPSPSAVIAVTKLGAYMTISRTRNIDQLDALSLMEWVEGLGHEDVKKGA